MYRKMINVKQLDHEPEFSTSEKSTRRSRLDYRS